MTMSVVGGLSCYKYKFHLGSSPGCACSVLTSGATTRMPGCKATKLMIIN